MPHGKRRLEKATGCCAAHVTSSGPTSKPPGAWQQAALRFPRKWKECEHMGSVEHSSSLAYLPSQTVTNPHRAAAHPCRQTRQKPQPCTAKLHQERLASNSRNRNNRNRAWDREQRLPAPRTQRKLRTGNPTARKNIPRQPKPSSAGWKEGSTTATTTTTTNKRERHDCGAVAVPSTL